MFPARYFGKRYFGPRYFGKVGTAFGVPVQPNLMDMHDGVDRRHRAEVYEPDPRADQIRASIARARRRIEGGDNLPPKQEKAAAAVVARIEHVVQAAPELFVRGPLIDDLLASLEAVGSRLGKIQQRTAIAHLRQVEQEVEDEQAAIMLLLAD